MYSRAKVSWHLSQAAALHPFDPQSPSVADVAAFDPGAQLPFHNVPPIWLEPDAERCWGLLQSE